MPFTIAPRSTVLVLCLCPLPNSTVLSGMQSWLLLDFGLAFPRWALKRALCDVWLSFDSLTLEWISDLCSAFRVAVNDLAWRENHVRGKLFRHQVDLDLLHYGGSLSHAIIKPPKPLAPGSFALPVDFYAALVRRRGKQQPLLHVQGSCMPDTSLPCQLGDSEFQTTLSY